MKEVEVKARLHDKEAVMTKLKALGCVFESPIVQNDIVYAQKVGSLKTHRTNDMFLRIRVKNNTKILFTLKKKGLNDLDSIEHEFEIGSKSEMENCLALMGYKEAVRVNKSRVITHYDGCEICIDDVENLGTFIEMEKITLDGDSKKIQDELFGFLVGLGIKKEDRMFSGYDILLMQKMENSERN